MGSNGTQDKVPMESNETQDYSNVGVHKFKNIPGLAECFLELCYAEIGKHGYQGSSLKGTSWTNVREGIEDAFGLSFDQKALKNHWDKIKINYALWREITSGTGGGVNYTTGEINWTEEKWNQVLKKHPKAKTFKTTPLKNAELVIKVFEKVNSGGDSRYCIAQDGLPSDGITSNVTVEDTDQSSQRNYCSDSYWEDLNIESDPPTQQHAVPSSSNGNTTTVPKKRKKRTDHSDDEIQKVITLLERQFQYMREESESRKIERAIQKQEEESYSLAECIEVLNMLKSFNNITSEHYSKAMVKLVENKECRKALMTIEKVEDKEAFVKGLAMF